MSQEIVNFVPIMGPRVLELSHTRVDPGTGLAQLVGWFFISIT